MPNWCCCSIRLKWPVLAGRSREAVRCGLKLRARGIKVEDSKWLDQDRYNTDGGTNRRRRLRFSYSCLGRA
jgi:hypothetical protein